MNHDEADLARRYLPLVNRLAYDVARRVPSHVSVQDLMSVGRLGLAEAIARRDLADPSPESFEAYAIMRIRGAILDELRRLDPLSRDTRRAARRIGAVAHELTMELCRPPDEAELASRLGVSIDRLRAKQRDIQGDLPLSFDDEVASAQLSGNRPPSPEAALLRKERHVALARLMGRLPARLQEVLQLHYGNGWTLRQIGEKFELTESRICQLHTKALKALRELAASEAPDSEARRTA